VNCFQKFEFNITHISDHEDVTELSTGKDDWGQVKASVLFQEHVSCDVDLVIG
jgi:hypothetical protein